MKGTWKLHLRMWLASILMFVLLYVILSIVGFACGLGGSVLFYLILTLAITFIQYLIGPKMVEMSMNVQRVSPEEAPDLHRMVEELANNAGLPKSFSA